MNNTPLPKEIGNILTEKFVLQQYTKSAKAKLLGIEKINNSPNLRVVDAMLLLHEYITVPLLERFKKEDGYILDLNGAYRCKQVNDAVGSNDKSDHLKGMAGDYELWKFINGKWIECNNELWEHVVKNMKFKQIIDEYSKSWIHIAWQKNNLACIKTKIGK
jgi:hypothetical protein